MIIIQILAIYVFDVNNFTMIVYTFPKRAIEMMLAISLVLANGYFLVDMIYCYIEMKDAIVIRTNKQTYYKIIGNKFFFCLLCMVIIQCFFNYLVYGNISIFCAILYYMVFIMLFFIAYKVLNKVSVDILILLFSSFIVVLKLVTSNLLILL